MTYAYRSGNSAAIGGFFEDLADYVTDPTNLIRLVTFQGWTSILTSTLPGLLGIAANQVIVALPGLARGEPFADALVAEYTWRLSNIVKYGGEEKAKQANQTFDQVTKDPALKQQFEAVKQLKAEGLSTEEALRQLRLTPDHLFERCTRQNQTPNAQETLDRCRQDMLALGINYHVREQVYDTRNFDVVTGKPLPSSLLELNKRRRQERLRIRETITGPGNQPARMIEEMELGHVMAVPPGYVNAPMGSVVISPKPRGSILSQLLTLGIVTSPAWLVLAGPSLARTFRRYV